MTEIEFFEIVFLSLSKLKMQKVNVGNIPLHLFMERGECIYGAVKCLQKSQFKSEIIEGKISNFLIQLLPHDLYSFRLFVDMNFVESKNYFDKFVDVKTAK